ncbi:putative profilin, partial [Trypanosoma cruzi]
MAGIYFTRPPSGAILAPDSQNWCANMALPRRSSPSLMKPERRMRLQPRPPQRQTCARISGPTTKPWADSGLTGHVANPRAPQTPNFETQLLLPIVGPGSWGPIEGSPSLKGSAWARTTPMPSRARGIETPSRTRRRKRRITAYRRAKLASRSPDGLLAERGRRYGVTLFVCGGHFGHAFVQLPLFHQGSATTVIRTSPRDCAGDIPGEPSAGSGWLGREIATHGREHNCKRSIKPTEKASAAIITDASLHGWVAVFIPYPGGVKIAGGKWERKPFLIMQADARAARLALSAFPAVLPSTMDFSVENTLLQGAANKGSSKSHVMARELQRIFEFLDSRGVQASFAYVR